MIKTLRTRLLIGIAPLLAIMVGLGLWAIVMFYQLGGNIDVILRENYRSVRAAEGMKEALERMDSAAMFAIGGQEDRALVQSHEYRPLFLESLRIEQNNVTLPGEQELADELTRLHGRYLTLADRFFALPAANVEARKELYFNDLLPLFVQIKDRADDVLTINQRNMEEMDLKARSAAAGAIRLMVVALAGAAVVATLIAVALSRSILEPIRSVTRAARAMAQGDMHQVVPVVTHDELGALAAVFNAMARTIREFQEAGTARLVRAQQTAQATIDSFPDPVVVVDPAGAIERANPAARAILGAAPTDGSIPWVPPPLLKTPLADVLNGAADHLPTSLEHALGIREDGQERFFLPRVLAIRDDRDDLLGAAVVLTDVTKFRLVDQLKSDMVSTVSHELKTPLTSVQMTIHLLLEELVGPLTAKQTELLLAARQDSDRLLAMINDLLDLTRIEQGRIALDLKPVAPADLVSAALDRFSAQAHDAEIALTGAVAFGLPPVLVDAERVAHVFDNLISNALAHTPCGGAIAVKVDAVAEGVRFAVADTGEGIAPAHQSRIFEKFYRVPGALGRAGAGLGLAIAREIIAAHNGRIDVHSEPGHGTTFTFILPAAVENGAATIEAITPCSTSSTS